MSFTGILYITISFFGLVSTIVTVYHLALFLSYYESTEQACKLFGSGQSARTEHTWEWVLFKDFSLLSLFIIQHTFMALPNVKQILYDYGLGTIQRSLYVIATCASLQCLIRNWEPVSSQVWWAVVSGGSGLYILWRVAHICAWILIYVGSIVFDLLELLGIRQVVYTLNSLPPPMSFKSTQLCRFYQHMRHPSFCGLAAILWLCPIMTTDRVLLAFVWTIFMAARWTVDNADYLYQHRQLIRKTDQLSEKSYQYT